MRRQEFPHHTPEQVAGYLADALRIVDDAELPPEFQQAAFTEAVRLLAAKQIIFEEPPPVGVPLIQSSSLWRQ